MITAHKFDKQEKILYCFKLVEDIDSVHIVKYVIPEYERNHFSSYRIDDYRFEGKFINSRYKTETVRADKIDRVANNKFYSFNSDQRSAERAFESYFKNRLVAAETELTTAKQRYELWRSSYAQGETTTS